MNIQTYKDFLLGSIPTSKLVSGGTHIACRCFYCPDGRNPSSKHFYISIPQSNDEPSMYYCHKCHASGIVTYKTLLDWGIYDDQIAEDLIEHNKNASKKIGNRKYFKSDHYVLHNIITTDSEVSRYKLKYFNDRIGTNLSYDELRDLKIVLNLGDIFKTNQLENTRNPNIMKELDQYFLGFLSIDNAFLNMRRTIDEGIVYKGIDKRYINYKVFDKVDTSERFYTIPTMVDLGNKERLNIHIAEGPFDIVSVYINLRQREPGIYSAIGGSNYHGQVSYFLRLVSNPYINFHIYPDNDNIGSNQAMNKLAMFLKPTGAHLFIHRNIKEGEKDFGVPIDRINEAVMQLI